MAVPQRPNLRASCTGILACAALPSCKTTNSRILEDRFAISSLIANRSSRILLFVVLQEGKAAQARMPVQLALRFGLCGTAIPGCAALRHHSARTKTRIKNQHQRVTGDDGVTSRLR